VVDSITQLIDVGKFTPHINISFVVYFFGSILGLLVVYWYMKPKMMPILVGIKAKRGNGTIKIFDDAAIQKIDGTKQLYVYKLNRYWPVPENKYFYPVKMGLFKKWYIDMYLDTNDEIVPNELIENLPAQQRGALKKLLDLPKDIATDVKRAMIGRPPKKSVNPDGTQQFAPVVMLDDKSYTATLVPKRREMELWGQLQRKRVAERFANDFMTKYAMVIGQGMVAVMMIIIVVVMMNKFTDISNNLAKAYEQALTILQAMGRT